MIEVLSTCNVNWHMTPAEAMDWGKEHMVAYYPLGDTKVSDAVRAMKDKV
jgi:2-oxoglutarate ferredoxin oxidoreductase subunit beta